jgi:hypothetical protein
VGTRWCVEWEFELGDRCGLELLPLLRSTGSGVVCLSLSFSLSFSLSLSRAPLTDGVGGGRSGTAALA